MNSNKKSIILKKVFEGVVVFLAAMAFFELLEKVSGYTYVNPTTVFIATIMWSIGIALFFVFFKMFIKKLIDEEPDEETLRYLLKLQDLREEIRKEEEMRIKYERKHRKRCL